MKEKCMTEKTFVSPMCRNHTNGKIFVIFSCLKNKGEIDVRDTSGVSRHCVLRKQSNVI